MDSSKPAAAPAPVSAPAAAAQEQGEGKRSASPGNSNAADPKRSTTPAVALSRAWVPCVPEQSPATASVLSLVGNTPLLELSPNVFAKCEFLNPGGSIKDRIAKHIVVESERSGRLRKGMIIAEATSGNTGIGLALAGRVMGYRVAIFMPEVMSVERQKVIRALGADLVLTPKAEFIEGSVRRVHAFAASNPNVMCVDQFSNPLNPEAHYATTGPEIWAQMGGRVDAFVAGVGSGGTLQGVGKYLRERNPDCKIFAVEPDKFSAILGIEPGLNVLHCIQGIGDGFVPEVLDTAMLSGVITVADDDALYLTRKLAKERGLLVGTSSGANFFGALQVSSMLGPNARVATVLADRAERYFSTALF
eukprot:m51a1_g9718 putative cysteine synthase (362) ;mRNA; f:1435892-1437179